MSSGLEQGELLLLFLLKELFVFLFMKVESSETVSLGHRCKATQDLRDLQNSHLLWGREGFFISVLQRNNEAREVK